MTALVGKFAMIDDDETDTYRLIKVVAHLEGGYVLGDIIDPESGDHLFEAQMLYQLSDLNGFIFDSYEEVQRFASAPPAKSGSK